MANLAGKFKEAFLICYWFGTLALASWFEMFLFYQYFWNGLIANKIRYFHKVIYIVAKFAINRELT